MPTVSLAKSTLIPTAHPHPDANQDNQAWQWPDIPCKFKVRLEHLPYELRGGDTFDKVPIQALARAHSGSGCKGLPSRFAVDVGSIQP